MTEEHVEDLLRQFHAPSDKNGHPDGNDLPFIMSPRTAAEEILHQLRSCEPQTLSLVMLGPLTNLALAMRADDERLSVLSRVKSIVVMGGAIHQPTPGISIRREFSSAS